MQSENIKRSEKEEMKVENEEEEEEVEPERKDIGLFNNITNIVLIVIQNRCLNCLAAKIQAISQFAFGVFVLREPYVCAYVFCFNNNMRCTKAAYV